ncbi:MAG: PQQ-like beta-propeller repeat protein [Kiritimatiellales bacterium]|nr:PQQ-like beta-propeller repeat protein [Kiritimatiellales bacterium]
MKTCRLILLATLCAWCGNLHAVAAPDTLRSFSTGGHTIYHLHCGQLSSGGETVLIGAAFDGTVMCFSKEGKLIWKNSASTAFPFDLEVADIDGDGQDETLVAAADGALYAFSHTGKLLWKFAKEPPLLQVCAVKKPDGKTVILTGGVERKLYALSPRGNVLNTMECKYVVRHIRAGDILGDGKQIAAVITAKNDRSKFMMRLIDPDGLKEVWDKPLGLTTKNPTEGTKYAVAWAGNKVPVVSMLITDFDGDGKDDIGLSNYYEKKGGLLVYNHKGEKILTGSGKGPKNKPYRMNLITQVRTKGDRVLGLYGHEIILYRMNGVIEKFLAGPYALSCCAFDDRSNTAWFGSSISGGDGIYALKLDQPEWENAFKQLKPVGRMAQIETNLKTMEQQVEKFEIPPYQRPPRKTEVVTGKSADDLRENFLDHHDYRNVAFTQFNLFTEDFDRETLEGVWKTKRETRHKYNYTAKEIIAFAAEREKEKEPFALWAGHGNDPFYMQLSTIKGILKAAPTTCKALVYPEMTHVSDDMAYAIRSHIIPVIELCRKHGTAKVVLRNKAGFWNANCYLDLWRDILIGGKYKDVIIPSMEETNGRNQAVTLSARMGLWLTGNFDRFAGRAVTDNANFSRFWEWGAQQKQSHLLRSMALRAALGSDMFLINIYQGDERDMTPFYRMIEKGVIAIPDREELLSLSDFCLGMKQPAESYVESGNNGHDMSRYEPDRQPAVFDRLDCFWGGAPTAPHDFSNYAMGSARRMLNFMPRNPYGMIALVPAETDLKSFPWFKSMIATDGVYFYDKAGRKISAPDAKTQLEKQLRAAADRLPVLVRGDVAWTVVRLDPTHVRVMLVDSGYTDPADRKAEIILQHLKGTQCRDILSGEKLLLTGQSTTLTVPAGTLRVVDITHH